MCPYCGNWLFNADSALKKAQAERGQHGAICSSCKRLVFYGSEKPQLAEPKEPRQLTFVFED